METIVHGDANTSFTPEDEAFLSGEGISLPHPGDASYQPEIPSAQPIGDISFANEELFDPTQVTDPSMGFSETRTRTNDHGRSDSHMDDAPRD